MSYNLSKSLLIINQPWGSELKSTFFIIFLLLFSLNSYSAGFTQTDVTVTATSTKFLEVNSSRTYLVIQNKGSVDVYFKVNSASTSTEGIKLPSGGAYEPIEAPINSIFLKTASSTATVTIIEGN